MQKQLISRHPCSNSQARKKAGFTLQKNLPRRPFFRSALIRTCKRLKSSASLKVFAFTQHAKETLKESKPSNRYNQGTMEAYQCGRESSRLGLSSQFQSSTLEILGNITICSHGSHEISYCETISV